MNNSCYAECIIIINMYCHSRMFLAGISLCSKQVSRLQHSGMTLFFVCITLVIKKNTQNTFGIIRMNGIFRFLNVTFS
jgi:hypothetical protein